MSFRVVAFWFLWSLGCVNLSNVVAPILHIFDLFNINIDFDILQHCGVSKKALDVCLFDLSAHEKATENIFISKERDSNVRFEYKSTSEWCIIAKLFTKQFGTYSIK